ncbi:MAG: SHOCT domain-containing protein [Alphaproteobacteria bacterium]|nr:MAG: SHOCT domain-containing protein [Alphaproteobacteria bacterium]
MKRILLLLAGAVLVAPALAKDPEVIQLSADTYMVTYQNHAGIFARDTTTKKKVIETASRFAESKGMVLQPISMDFRDVGNGPAQWPSADYTFRLVPKGQESGAVDPAATSTSSNPDMYTELLRLDDLHKKGILTDAEFAGQKAKILARP